MSESEKNLAEEARRQILKVTIPGSGVVTKSGFEVDEDEGNSD